MPVFVMIAITSICKIHGVSTFVTDTATLVIFMKTRRKAALLIEGYASLAIPKILLYRLLRISPSRRLLRVCIHGLDILVKV